jgi:hypothetical protein
VEINSQTAWLGRGWDGQPLVSFCQECRARTLEIPGQFAYLSALVSDIRARLGFQLNPSTTLDVGYRYLNAGQTTKLINPQTGLTLRQNNFSRQLLVGIRYVLQ